MNPRRIRGLLFDLDGTLVDSAPDLLAVVAELRGAKGLPWMDLSGCRHVANKGAAGLLELGFGSHPEHDLDALRREFLNRYAERCFQDSHAFPGIEALLGILEENRIPWGVVTNKPGDLACSVLDQAGWLNRAGCLVAGDSLPVSKPDPAPVRKGAGELGLDCADCLLLGDDPRDILAGQRAGAMTGLATWGYLEPGTPPESLGADLIISHPDELARLIFNALPEPARR